ncbi:MAG: ATP-binding cassette domain-containing protein, partial [Pseudomonas caspiana]
MNDHLIEIRNLRVAFKGAEVVHGINLDIKRGECLALVGESGSGKSVTAHSILRLLPGKHVQTQGSITYSGIDLVRASEQQLRGLRGNRIAMIFQEPMTSLNPLHTVEQQVSEVLALHKGLKGKAARNRTLELLELVGIQQPLRRLKAYPHQLSGGQRQRVMIAMALANEPELLIADEPTTALDVTVQLKILELLRSLQARLGMSLLLISHDLNLVRRVAQRVCVMRAGEIVEQAECQTLFESPQHPYSRLLIEAEPDGSPAPHTREHNLLTVDDLKVWFALPKPLFSRHREHIKAVDGISLELQRGKTLGIVGESGSGKSTLGQAILRLVDSEGAIRFGNKELSLYSQDKIRPLRRQMQVVFQDPFGSLSPRMSVGQIIAEGLNTHGIGSRTERDAAVIRVLEEVGLDPQSRHRYPHEFSGGQRQRISIA